MDLETPRQIPIRNTLERRSPKPKREKTTPASVELTTGHGIINGISGGQRCLDKEKPVGPPNRVRPFWKNFIGAAQRDITHSRRLIDAARTTNQRNAPAHLKAIRDPVSSVEANRLALL